MLAGPASPGLLFFSKMDFHRPHVSQKSSNDNASVLQHVSSLPFVPKTRSVNRLFRIPTFLLLIDFRRFAEKLKKRVFKKKSAPQADSLKLIIIFFYDFFFFCLMPRPIFARPFWAAGGGNPGKLVWRSCEHLLQPSCTLHAM